MATFTELLANLDHTPQVRGRQFEQICQWYLRHDPKYRAELEDVWLWDEWPERDGRDLGIDLVARTKDGKLWAIQAKAYDPEKTLRKSDVDSFLANSARSDFAFRLILTTCQDLTHNLRKQFTQVEPPVSARVLSDLESATLTWPDSPDDLRAPKPDPKTPRAHQKEAIQAVLKGFKKHDRGRLVMACGTGKTLVGLWVAEKLKAERTLVLLPSLSLLGQTMEEWLANGSRSPEVLAVCSDKTVRGDTDAWVSDTSELGIPVTTDPVEIAAFLDRPRPKLVFSTYQSSPEIAKAQKLTDVTFDLVVADEAHRCAGRVSGAFATILKAEEIRADRRLFMTATPRYFTGRVKKVAELYDHELASMDDEPNFGPEFHQLTFGEAIERDLLSPYQVVIIGVDDPTYKDYAERGRLVTRDGRDTDARTLATQVALAKAMKKYDLRRVITFHSRIKKARDFATDFPQVVEWMSADDGPGGDIWCDHVSGKMPTSQRKARLDRLREINGGGRGLLANARCLGEGVDVPTLDGVAFVDPRRSQVDIVQNVGRAIRKADDKRVGTIVLPVFIDQSQDPETAVADSHFKPIWDVLRALRDHDDTLAEWLDAIRVGIGGGGSFPLGDSDGPLRLDLAVGEEFVRAFQARLIEQTTESWEFWYGLLEAFVEREGHAGVPQMQIEGDRRLGIWVSTQRRLYQKGSLSADRIARLEALPGWIWDTVEAAWNEGFERLKSFVAREGHAGVLQSHTENGYNLGSWVGSQRGAWKAGRLPQDHIARLQGLPGWIWDRHEARWEEGFESLQRFVEREGHAQVPKRHSDRGYKLGSWTTDQRKARRAGRLSPERMSRLDSLPGWIWDPVEALWEEGFESIRSFIAREGHARIPTNHTEGRFNLGQWISDQRKNRKAGRLSLERISQLEALCGWTWDEVQARWEEGFEHLQSFVAREGHLGVPWTHMEGHFNLGNWVSRQRSNRNDARLPPDRMARLEALPGWSWDSQTEVRQAVAWEEGCEKLKSFVAREGHAYVPIKHTEDGYYLGTWVGMQRASWKAGDLLPDRVSRLEAFPGWIWDTIAARWEEGLAALQSFVAREGHAAVPVKHVEDGYRLGVWSAHQRTARKAGRLSPDRISHLAALPGWKWNPEAAVWEKGFEKLQAFAAREGHTRVPTKHLEGDYTLGKWVSRRRRERKAGRLSPDRIARLEALPGWVWDARNEK